MPLYEFVCPSCRHRIEKKLTFSQYDEEKGKIVCQKCDEKMIQKVFAPPFSLKGNGWFEQGYGITDMETAQNLDQEKMIENEAKEMQEKDKQKHREF